MNSQYLKVLSDCLCAFLSKKNLNLKHGQTLDLVAAVPGLRNWPEVISFPEKVEKSEWDMSSSTRLAKRILNKYKINLDPQVLYVSLEEEIRSTSKTIVWPKGPAAGIYLTTSQNAVDNLIRRYEAATDAPLYAEGAGNNADSAIDLGEYGIFSKGLLKIPSGTLIVMGPLELTQEAWNDNKERLLMASGLAAQGRLRIAILCRTPQPDNLFYDINLLLNEVEVSSAVDEFLRGKITDDGELEEIKSLPLKRPSLILTPAITPIVNLPKALTDLLTDALSVRPKGILIIGSNEKNETRAAVLEAALPYLSHAGSAVRIQPTFRSGYGKDSEPLSARFEGIPVFPSIESAFGAGYRRMIIESPYYGGEDAMLKYGHEACFLISVYATEVMEAFIHSLKETPANKSEILGKIIAVLCVAGIETTEGKKYVCDAIGVPTIEPGSREFKEVWDYLTANRQIRWEDQLTTLLKEGLVTPSQIKKEFRTHDIEEFLKKIDKNFTTKRP